MSKTTNPIIALFFFIFTQPHLIYAQGNNEKLLELADEAFKANHYQSAIDYYKQAEANAPEIAFIKYMLGESYRNIFRYSEAENNYQKVISLGARDYPLVYFNLGLTKKLNSKYAEAAETFDKFIAFAETESFPEQQHYLERARTEREGCYMAIDHSSIAFREFNLVNLPAPVNSRFNDYAAYPYLNDSNIVITSGREEAVGKKEDSGFDEDQTDCFRFASNGGNVWKKFEQPDNFDKMNGSSHEGAGSFNADRTKYYFTKCASADCAIYSTQWKDGKWQPAVKLNENINTKGTESKHPFVSGKGDTLFFVSNRPGGYGLNDIYMSVSKGNDQWGQAINLGSRINTRLNEASPFYFSKEGIFCFSSQGHTGYGGLDIFTVHHLFTSPQIKNIGKPFNSHADDFYFVFGSKTGYLSSNRTGGKGKFDVYAFRIHAEESVIALLEKREYAVMAKATEMKKVLGSINMSKLEKSEYTTISGNLVDRTTGKPMKGVEVFLVDENGQIVRSVMSDENGYFTYSRISPHHNYSVTVKKGSGVISEKQELNVAHLKVEEYSGNVVAPSMNKLDVVGVNSVSISGGLVDPVTGKPLKSTEVSLVNEKGEIVQTVMTDEHGFFTYSKVPSQHKYKVTVSDSRVPLSGKREINVADLKVEEYTENELPVLNTFNMDGFDNVSISGKLYDRTTGKILKNTEVSLVDARGEIVKVTSTNEQGFFRYSKIPIHQSYKVTVRKKSGLLSDKQELTITELKVEGDTDGPSAVKFESIYFDFDKAELRPEAKKTLDDLSHLCKGNSAIQIEIDAFTDFVGTDQYNIQLGLQRGNAALQYLIGKGVDRSSLIVNSKGRQNPIATNETLEGRQLNRRVEFVIRGAEEWVPTVSTYLIEPGMTLYSLAKKHNTTIEELIRLNGLQSSHIEAHRPLRVPLKGTGENSLNPTTPPFFKTDSKKLSMTRTYKVVTGDTVFSVAVAHQMTVERLKEINSLESDILLPGQLLKVEVRK